jgi:SAM-dependent methyltransferase
MSYWHQLRVALGTEPDRVLEIGSGTGVFRSYLRSRGIEVACADIDESRDADYVADVSRLDETLPAGLTFDLVVCCQVLEHLPFDKFEDCLRGIAARANPYALITLPYRGLPIVLKIGVDEKALTLGFRIPKPWPHKFDGQHRWELGWKYSPRKITRIMKNYFDVVKRHTIRDNPYHYLWLLRARK